MVTLLDFQRCVTIEKNGTNLFILLTSYVCLCVYFVLGAAPIATLNLQHCGEGGDIPDAWHHQMIFGVGQAGIYVTNPLECLPEQVGCG